MNKYLKKLNEPNKEKIKNYYTRGDQLLSLLSDLGGSAKPEMIYMHDATDIGQSRCYSILSKLEDRGMVTRPVDGFYRISRDGEARLAEIEEMDDLEKTF